ncbi:MAG: rod shape-determining protein MreC [Actinobacteria bacterium]|nr:rod shape-determining protein MreC [Actinomycetota bacterium]MBW3649256.1 rod shape-determining protein MreC [Actinomycetota bacterium]
MAVYRRPARSRFTLLLLVLTSVTLLTLDYRGSGSGAISLVKDGARDGFAPIQRFSDRLMRPVGNLVGGILHYGDLERENEQLRRENAEFRGDVLRADDAERERQALLDQLDLATPQDIPRVDARVVATSPTNFAFTVEIDKGTSSGLATGMPVVTGTGLVGRVAETSQTRAVVQLLTDKKFSVGVRLATSGDFGVANGQGTLKSLSLDLIDPASPVDKDEVVVTSGLQQSQFPPGIPVGKVEQATTRPGGLQQDITIVPVVDLRRLSFVTVLQWSPG